MGCLFALALLAAPAPKEAEGAGEDPPGDLPGPSSPEREVEAVISNDVFDTLDLGAEGGRRELRRAIEGGLAFLAERQSAETGSLGARYQVAVTSLAGLAFLGAGYGYHRGKHGRCVARCVSYLLRGSNSDPVAGFLARSGDEHPMHGHGYAVLFLSQVYGELPQREQAPVGLVIRRGIEVIASARSWEGGWYYWPNNDQHRDESSVTVCVLQALRAARNVGFAVEDDLIEGAERYLKRCQNRDGSFQYSLSQAVSLSSFELTSGAVASLQALGIYRSDEVKRGLDYLRRCADEVRMRPLDAAKRYRFYGNFYAAQAFHMAGDQAWNAWYPRAFKQLILEGREKEGRWTSRFGEEYATAMAVLTLEVPLGYLPIFQR